MKRFKGWYVLCAAIITLFFGLPSRAQAEGRFIGFEYGVDYIEPTESRFDGAGSYFSVLFPIDKGITAGIYHETNRYSGEDTAAGAPVNVTLDIDINELRIQKEIVSFVEVFLGAGYASVTNAFNTNAPVADVGVKITPFKRTKGTLSDIKLSLDLLYRFLTINSQQPFGANVSDPNIDDLGGFAIGFNVAVLF